MAKAVSKVKKVLPARARVALALEPGLRKEVEEACKSLDMTLSEVMRNLLRGFVSGEIKLTRSESVTEAMSKYFE